MKKITTLIKPIHEYLMFGFLCGFLLLALIIYLYHLKDDYCIIDSRYSIQIDTEFALKSKEFSKPSKRQKLCESERIYNKFINVNKYE